MCIYVVIVAEWFCQRAAACLIDAVQRIIRICDLMHSFVHVLVEIVVNAQAVNLNGLSDVIRRRGWLSEAFCGVVYISEKKVVKMKGLVLENEEITGTIGKELKERERDR